MNRNLKLTLDQRAQALILEAEDVVRTSPLIRVTPPTQEEAQDAVDFGIYCYLIASIAKDRDAVVHALKVRFNFSDKDIAVTVKGE